MEEEELRKRIQQEQKDKEAEEKGDKEVDGEAVEEKQKLRMIHKQRCQTKLKIYKQ